MDELSVIAYNRCVNYALVELAIIEQSSQTQTDALFLLLVKEGQV